AGRVPAFSARRGSRDVAVALHAAFSDRQAQNFAESVPVPRQRNSMPVCAMYRTATTNFPHPRYTAVNLQMVSGTYRCAAAWTQGMEARSSGKVAARGFR